MKAAVGGKQRGVKITVKALIIATDEIQEEHDLDGKSLKKQHELDLQLVHNEH